MSTDAFLMKFDSGDVVPLPIAAIVASLEPFGSVGFSEAGAFIQVEDTIADCGYLKLAGNGDLESICLAGAILDEPLAELALALMSQFDMAFFDESHTAIYALRDISADVPADLLRQVQHGVHVLTDRKWVWLE